MPQWLPGQSTIYKAAPSVGQQTPIQSGPMKLASVTQQAPQTAQVDVNTFRHLHAGHPEPHPIALRHSAAHTDALHAQEDKIVAGLMKLADKANEGACTGEELGQLDAGKMQLAQIQQRRTDEIQRLNTYMRQQISTAEDPTNPGVEQDVVNPDQPDGKRMVNNDMQNEVGDASTASATGMRTTAQLSSASGGWGGYSNGLSYQQKAVKTRTLSSREKFATKSDYAADTGAITPAKPIGGGTPSTSPARPQGGTAKPNKSVFQKSQPFDAQMPHNPKKGTPVTEEVGTIAPDDAGDPDTEFKKITAGSTYKGWYGQQRAN